VQIRGGGRVVALAQVHDELAKITFDDRTNTREFLLRKWL
jgi:hypothetical protein